MIISEIQSEIGHCSCDSAKLKAPADFSHHSILLFDIVLKLFAKGHWQTTKLSTGIQRVITGKYFSVQYIGSYG